MPRFRTLALLIALAMVPAGLAAQVGVTTDIITGRVTGPDGQGVAGASIEVVSTESNVRRTTTTRPDGRYTLTFPEGGGRYRVRVAALGFAPQTATLARESDEDVLTTNFRLSVQAVAIQGISATATRTPPPGRGETGAVATTVSGELANRLPLADTDPATIATLSPGVVATQGADSTSGRGSFSVAGQRESLNQFTVDGASFASALTGGQFGGGSPLSLPQEGLRGTQVVTNSYDVSRGQFTGGQVAMTTRAGTNFVQGSFQWNLRDPLLQGNAGRPAWGGGFTQNRVSGGVGGPIVKDRLFYYASFAAQRRTDALFALTPGDPGALLALGVSPDSVDRFLSVLSARGINAPTGRFDRTNDALTFLGRVDWSINQQHTLALRGNLNLSGQDRTRIGYLETLENGGQGDSDGKGLIATLTSRFGGSWINELRASLTDDRRDQTPYAEVPEGRVRVTSVLEDGRQGVATLAFGGDRSFPTTSRETTVETSDELSFLWRDQHRIKLGGLLNHTGFDQRNTFNRLGSFEFNSLEDFAAGRPSLFTRSLTPRTTSGGGVNAALYLGDTWRPTQKLQITVGLRGEASGFDSDPAYNPAVDSLFGRRTDQLPGEVHVSPRAGFSLRLSEQGQPLRQIRGGFGEFRGRAPYSLYASAIDQTGLGGTERQLVCPDTLAPVPDWPAYESDPSSIPSTCVGGGTGAAFRTGRPAVTLLDPDFAAPRSWRGSLGFQAQIRRTLGVTFDVSQAWGVSLFGVRDLNLDTTRGFTLASEGGRPVYVPASAIGPTGTTTLFASRVHPEFAQVFDVFSDLRSNTTLATFGINGALPPRVLFNLSYTWMRSRDQSSFSGGQPQFGFTQVAVAGDPNVVEWARSDLERRHQIVSTVALPFSETLEITFIARASSGRPFTPLVGGDINGDGAMNDRAFIFTPGAAPDTAVANGMTRLLSGVDGRVRSCLQSQAGKIAARNSCTGGWTTSLDFRSTIRPPQVKGRRLSISLDATNLPAGLDLLLHGEGGLHGWGQNDFGRDPVLLYPRGFDPAAQRYVYQVNENFGQTRIRRAAVSPFQVALSARVAVGRQQQGATGIGGLASIAFGQFGGGGGGGRDGGGREGGGGFRGQGGGIDADALADRLVPEPVSAIILLRDTLHLSDDQVARLQAISDSLKAKNAPMRDTIRAAVAQAGNGADPGAIFQRIGPRLASARQNVQAALDQAQKVLTPEQWRRVPAALRNPLGGFGPGGGGFGGFGGGGGGRRPREGQQTPPAPSTAPTTQPTTPPTTNPPVPQPAPTPPPSSPEA